MDQQNHIPKSISHGEFLNAVQPLLDLLGTTSSSVYTAIPIVIDLNDVFDDTGSISFALAAGESDEHGRAKDVRTIGPHPQGNPFRAAAHMIRVKITEFPT